MTPSSTQPIVGAVLWLALRSGEANSAPTPARPAHPPGTVGHQEPASTGVTKLESKFPTVDAATAEDTLEAEAGAGGQFNTGNARSSALTAQARFRIRRRRYEFSTIAVGNYAQATEREDNGTSKTRTTAGNVQPMRSSAVDTDGGRDRLKAWVNWEAALTTSLTEKFVFATTFTLRYDNTPLPGVKRLDTITAFNLVYRFL